MDVYLLWHMRPLEDDPSVDPTMVYIETDDKLCGVFANKRDAENAKEFLTTQPGFMDYPNDFVIATYTLGKIEWSEGFITD